MDTLDLVVFYPCGLFNAMFVRVLFHIIQYFIYNL